MKEMLVPSRHLSLVRLLLLMVSSIGICAENSVPLQPEVFNSLPAAVGTLTPVPARADGVIPLSLASAGIAREQNGSLSLVKNPGELQFDPTTGAGKWRNPQNIPCWRAMIPKEGDYRIVVAADVSVDNPTAHGLVIGHPFTATFAFVAGEPVIVRKDVSAPRGKGPQNTDYGTVHLKVGEQAVAYQVRCELSFWDNLREVDLIPVGTEADQGRALFPTGYPSTLPKQAIDGTLPPITLQFSPPGDQPQRAKEFAERDSEAGVAQLCQQFYKVVDPTAKGLESFNQLYQAGNYRGALEAYRTYFFDKLKHPGKYTSPYVLWLPGRLEKSTFLRNPDPATLEQNRHGCAVAQIDNRLVIGEVGSPGSVNWCPPELQLPEGVTFDYLFRGKYLDSPEGKELQTKLMFQWGMRDLPGGDGCKSSGLFTALLDSYGTTHTKSDLDLWCAYMDDYTTYGRRDEINGPLRIRLVTELINDRVEGVLGVMRVLLDEQPDFVTDFHATTLARMLMSFTSEYPPYVIRMRRAENSNWGIMGLSQVQRLAQFFYEFRAMAYAKRETWRLWRYNTFNHITLDGEDIEAFDRAHQGIDFDFAMQSIPYVERPADSLADLESKDFWDNLYYSYDKLFARELPNACFYLNDYLNVMHGESFWLEKPIVSENWLERFAQGKSYAESLAAQAGDARFCTRPDSPEAQRRQLAIASGTGTSEMGPPQITSEISPYGGFSYLRSSWKPDAEYFMMNNTPQRTEPPFEEHNYTLIKGGLALVDGSPILVDQCPPDIMQGKPLTGGKTVVCVQAARHVRDIRFHTSDRFDVTEAIEDFPYSRENYFGRNYDIPSLSENEHSEEKDPQPITDVKANRLVFSLRGEGLYIISDRVEAPADKQHEYAQCFLLPLRSPSQEKSENTYLVDPKGKSFSTMNPEVDNISINTFGPDRIVGGFLHGSAVGTTAFNPQPSNVVTKKGIKKGHDPIDLEIHVLKVSTRWHGTGNQSAVTVLNVRPAGSQDGLQNVQESKNPNGVTGFSAVTINGTQVWFQGGPSKQNVLNIGPAQATAEVLLVTQKNNETSGVVLGANSLVLNGKSYSATSNDFEYTLSPQGDFQSVPIHHPIDTVQILPEQTCFSGSLEVSFALPTQDTSDIEFRYTQDGSDPSLTSPLYTGPFIIKQTTLLKVRPFRKGLKEIPWTLPGVDAGRTVSAIFRLEAVSPTAASSGFQAGLQYDYFEDDWLKLISYVGIKDVLTPKKSGAAGKLLDPDEISSIVSTDKSYGFFYQGYLNVPAEGVYNFYAPEHLYTATLDAGFDLRVFVDGHEWLPNPMIHAENLWSISLAKGAHSFALTYVDYREKKFANEFFMRWHKEEMWSGTPVLEISGPNLARQPLPNDWLIH